MREGGSEGVREGGREGWMDRGRDKEWKRLTACLCHQVRQEILIPILHAGQRSLECLHHLLLRHIVR